VFKQGSSLRFTKLWCFSKIRYLRCKAERMSNTSYCYIARAMSRHSTYFDRCASVTFSPLKRKVSARRKHCEYGHVKLRHIYIDSKLSVGILRSTTHFILPDPAMPVMLAFNKRSHSSFLLLGNQPIIWETACLLWSMCETCVANKRQVQILEKRKAIRFVFDRLKNYGQQDTRVRYDRMPKDLFWPCVYLNS